MSLSKDQKYRRRAERKKRRQKKAAALQGRKPATVARCGGGGNYTREEMIAAADRTGEQGGVWAYFASPETVTIEETRVVNRGSRAVEVNIAICEQRPGEIDRVSTLQCVKIAAQGFIDFAVYNARPLLIASAFTDDDTIFQQLRDSDDDYCTPEPPQDFGPWRAADSVPGVMFNADYIHNAGLKPAMFDIVCRVETEGAGPVRCAIARLKIPGQYLGHIRTMADGAELELLLTDAEREAEAADWREGYMEDVAAGHFSMAEAQVRLAKQLDEAPWIDPETVELLAVVAPGTTRKAMRAIYDQAMSRTADAVGKAG